MGAEKNKVVGVRKPPPPPPQKKDCLRFFFRGGGKKSRLINKIGKKQEKNLKRAKTQKIKKVGINQLAFSFEEKDL